MKKTNKNIKKLNSFNFSTKSIRDLIYLFIPKKVINALLFGLIIFIIVYIPLNLLFVPKMQSKITYFMEANELKMAFMDYEQINNPVSVGELNRQAQIFTNNYNLNNNQNSLSHKVTDFKIYDIKDTFSFQVEFYSQRHDEKFTELLEIYLNNWIDEILKVYISIASVQLEAGKSSLNEFRDMLNNLKSEEVSLAVDSIREYLETPNQKIALISYFTSQDDFRWLTTEHNSMEVRAIQLNPRNVIELILIVFVSLLIGSYLVIRFNKKLS
tara:strand:- start:6582 stop:7391 length:810 start_codon:yes stop_codon:yes gene_type:complete